MKRTIQSTLLVCLLLLSAVAARAQSMAQAPFGLGVGQAPLLQVSGQYEATHANAPPGQCGCFWMQGGGIQINLSVRPAWSAMVDLSYAHNGAIDKTDETLTVTNFLIGPRYSRRTGSRFTPYGQVLAGGSHVGSNYAIYTSNNTFLGAEAGVGVEMYVTPRIAAVPLEGNWVFSRAVNGVNTRQNNLRVGIGVVYRLGPQ